MKEEFDIKKEGGEGKRVGKEDQLPVGLIAQLV